jgi:hypothetical protein
MVGSGKEPQFDILNVREIPNYRQDKPAILRLSSLALVRSAKPRCCRRHDAIEGAIPADSHKVRTLSRMSNGDRSEQVLRSR